MHILITHDGRQRTRAFTLRRWQLVMLVALFMAACMTASVLAYRYAFEGLQPRVVASSTAPAAADAESEGDQARFLRANLDAFAQRLGELQARMFNLETMGERVSGLAGVKPEQRKPASASAPAGSGGKATAATSRPASHADTGDKRGQAGGEGGPYIPADRPSLLQLNAALDDLELWVDDQTDLLTLAESRLLESKLQSLMVPSVRPIDGPLSSGFGFRTDPFTGRTALHTGLDFPAPTGTKIHAAAGGVVLSTDHHPAYGNLLQIDHGNGLVTRYAHTSKILVEQGDLIRRGQVVALVGSTGRSTGPHLHFEVMVDGSQQDPRKFLDRPVTASAR